VEAPGRRARSSLEEMGGTVSASASAQGQEFEEWLSSRAGT